MISNPNLDEIKNDEILINGRILVNGKITSHTVSKITEDDDGLPSQIITICGTLETDYYEQTINELESDRYYISGIECNEESFISDSNKITYNFTANKFQVKWQNSDTYKEIGTNNEERSEQQNE